MSSRRALRRAGRVSPRAGSRRGRRALVLATAGGGPAPDPGLTLLESATLWLDASDDIANAQWKRNKGTGGRTLDARQGSVGSAQVVKGALKLPGASSNYASTPDSAALSIVGDIDVRADIAMSDWTPGGTHMVIAKEAGSTTRSFNFFINTSGNIVFRWSPDGTAGGGQTATSSVAVGFADGDRRWVRATLDVSNGSSVWEVKFYTSTDGTSWTQLGTTQTGGAATSIFDGATALELGSYRTGVVDAGAGPLSIYRATVRNGYDGAGSVVFDANFTAVSDLATSFTESSANAATVTINSTSGVDTNDPLLLRHTGTNYLYLPGSAGNYASTPDAAVLDGFDDLEVIARVAASDWTPAGRSLVLGKRKGDSTDMSYAFGVTSGGSMYLLVGDGVSSFTEAQSSVVTGFTDGTAYWIRATRTKATGTVRFYYAADQASVPSSWTQLGTDVTGGVTGTIKNSAFPLAIGGYLDGVLNEPFAGSIYRVIIRNGIGGTTVFDADFTAVSDLATSFTESSANAATVTINSTSGVDTNDPLLLTHTGTNYLYLPGVANNFASVPDSAAISSTSTYEMISRVAFADYSTDNSFVVKRGTSPDRDYQWDTTANTIRFIGFNGSVVSRSVSIAGLFTNGTPYWFRVVADGSGTAFYYAADSSSVPSSWTQIGSTQASVGGFVNGTADLAIGGQASIGTWYAGRYYRFILRTTVGGTNQLDIDFTTNTNQSSFTESSSNAATVTINRAATGRKAVMVTRPVWLFGTDDYLEIADNALLDVDTGEAITALVIARQWPTQLGNTVLLTKFTGSFDEGWGIIRPSDASFTARAYLESGATAIDRSGGSYSSGVMTQLGAIIDRNAQTVAATVGSTIGSTSSIAALGSIATSATLRVGRNGGAGTSYIDSCEIVAVAVFRSALNSTQLGQIATYYGV